MPKQPSEGKQSMREIGRLGGESTRRKYSRAHYVRIGRRGGAKVRELIAKGRALEGESDG